MSARLLRRSAPIATSHQQDNHKNRLLFRTENLRNFLAYGLPLYDASGNRLDSNRQWKCDRSLSVRLSSGKALTEVLAQDAKPARGSLRTEGRPGLATAP
jgi:hypothetical protein